MPEARIVKEKRATVRQAVGDAWTPPLRPLANLALAGDWLTPLPATIESAVMAGERAVGMLGERFVRAGAPTGPSRRRLRPTGRP